MLTEIARLKTHGVRPGELERAKTRTLERFEQLLAEQDKTPSRRFAEEIVRLFANDEPMPGIALEAAANRDFLPSISLDEINGFVASDGFFPDTDRVVVVGQPEKEDLALPTVDELQSVESEVAASEIAPPKLESEVGPLLSQLPAPGEIVETSTAHQEALGFTVYTLSNGIRVWAKQTDFQEDQIIVQGFGDGGTSTVSDDVYVDAV